MRWKFWEKREERAAVDGYSDAITAALAAQAANADQEFGTGAEQACRWWWMVAFASADVSIANRATAALTPSVFAHAGVQLFDYGDSLWEIAFAGGRLMLKPVSNWQLTGGVYELQVPDPDHIVTRYRVPDAVLHLSIPGNNNQPWRGRSPGIGASVTRKLAAALENRLAEESGGPVGNLLPVPDTKGTDKLQADIAALKGKAVMVPTTAGNWGQGSQGAPRTDWQPNRLGPTFAPPIPDLRDGISAHLCAAYGVPPALVAPDADGTAQRESLRRFLHGTIQPVARLLEAELSAKLDSPGLTLSFDRLFASDLSGRARAFQSMVGGGLDVEKAATLSGLMESDDGA
ncbi:MAG: phage portal protein [Caldilineaceae bacterium]|nr:phage portal protein [Caldilineaceae bacterium]